MKNLKEGMVFELSLPNGNGSIHVVSMFNYDDYDTCHQGKILRVMPLMVFPGDFIHCIEFARIVYRAKLKSIPGPNGERCYLLRDSFSIEAKRLGKCIGILPDVKSGKLIISENEVSFIDSFFSSLRGEKEIAQKVEEEVELNRRIYDKFKSISVDLIVVNLMEQFPEVEFTMVYKNYCEFLPHKAREYLVKEKAVGSNFLGGQLPCIA